jgi:hypothetical protein
MRGSSEARSVAMGKEGPGAQDAVARAGARELAQKRSGSVSGMARRGMAGCGGRNGVHKGTRTDERGAGSGLALLPVFTGARDARLQQLFPRQPGPSRELFAVFHSDLRGNTRVSSFLSWIDGILRPSS